MKTEEQVISISAHVVDGDVASTGMIATHTAIFWPTDLNEFPEVQLALLLGITKHINDLLRDLCGEDSEDEELE